MRRTLAPAVVAWALILPPAAAADAVGLVVSSDGTRSVIRVDGPDGVLTSDSTRLRGLVTEDDYASADFEVVDVTDPEATVQTLDERIDWNDRWRLPLTVALAAVLIGLALVRPAWALRGLLVALAANLWLSLPLAALAGVAAIVLPLGWACTAILAAYLLAMGLDAETVALSAFGPSQVGRFYGVNNLLETMLLAPALVGAALLGRLGVLVAALAFVTIGGNRFGADGGGTVVLAAAYLVLWLRIRDRRLTWRLAAAVAGGAVAVALALVALDAATGASSHVTESVEDGPVALARDLADRVERSVRRTVDSAGATAVVVGSLAILAAVARRARRDPVLDAYLVGLAVSLVVNDTPADVLGAGAAIAVALARDTGARLSLSSAPMRRAALLLALLALAVGLGGCGGGEDETATPETVEGTLPEQTDTGDGGGSTLEGNAEAGASVYTSAGCGGCHTLEAAGSTGTVGPNLDESQPDFELAVDRVTNGSGAMPAFEGQLSEQEIADVAQYVVDSTS